MYFERNIYSDLSKHLTNKQITVLTGMRRTGKTTLLKQLMAETVSNNKIFLDLERLDNRELFSSKNYENIILALKQKSINPEEKIYLFLDEIQLVPNIPSVIKYLFDNYDIKFVITGSSSYYLKNMFTESLSGRKKIFELKTLSFYEFLKFKGVNVIKAEFPFAKISSYEFEQLNAHYFEYVEYGGFPEVVLSDLKRGKIRLT